METGTVNRNRSARKLWILAFFCLLALALAGCSSAAATSQPPDPAARPAAQPQPGGHPPVILRVVDREQVIDGSLWVYQDIYFTDPEGDAAAVTYALTSSSLTYPLNLTDDPIQASAQEQKAEALFTVTGKCWQKLELAFESRIRDAAGSLSEPVLFTMSCTAPQSLDTTPLLVSGLATALPIGLILLVGFWLLFRKRPADRLMALRSVILIFFVFMLLRFLQLVLHEGGHSLIPFVSGVPVTLYVHPFFFSGFSRPAIDSILSKDIMGSATAIPIGLLFTLPLWKRRSLALFPGAMLFPYIALNDGFNVMGLGGDFRNLVQATGLPAVLFLIVGAVIACIGLISVFSLLPLAGLDPRDNRALFVLPAATFLWGALSFLVALLFVPGSPIDLEYFAGREIMLSANSFIFLGIFGAVLAALYVTLFRKLYARLPSWLRTETVNLTWKDLRLPGLLWAASVGIGLIIVI